MTILVLNLMEYSFKDIKQVFESLIPCTTSCEGCNNVDATQYFSCSGVACKLPEVYNKPGINATLL